MEHNRNIGRCVSHYSWLKWYDSEFTEALSALPSWKLRKLLFLPYPSIHSFNNYLFSTYVDPDSYKRLHRAFDRTKPSIPLAFPRLKIFIDHSFQILKNICAKTKVKNPGYQSINLYETIVRPMTMLISTRWTQVFQITRPTPSSRRVNGTRDIGHHCDKNRTLLGCEFPILSFLPFPHAYPILLTLKKGCYSFTELYSLNYNHIPILPQVIFTHHSDWSFPCSKLSSIPWPQNDYYLFQRKVTTFGLCGDWQKTQCHYFCYTHIGNLCDGWWWCCLWWRKNNLMRHKC